MNKRSKELKSKKDEGERMREEDWESGYKKCFMVNSMRVILHASPILKMSEWDAVILLV